MSARVKRARTGSFLLPVLALVAILALSGCGGDDDSSDSATNETTTNAEVERDSGDSGEGGADGKGGEDGEGSEADGGSPGAKEGSNVPQPDGEEEPGITPEQKRQTTTADIRLESPSITPGKLLPVKYTCDGEDTWPALRWQNLPPGAEELVLLVPSLRPRNNELFFTWAVAGLDPSLKEIEEGKLPPGAIVGENSLGKRGYTLCPEPGAPETYIFMLFAIPEALDPEPGFDIRELREEVLDQSGNVGLINAEYKRK